MGKRKSNLLTGLLAVLLIGLGSSIASWLSGWSGNLVMAASSPSIVGVVKDGGGKPVRAAVVSATSSSGFRRFSSFTNSTGQYRITGLKPDSYRVSATGWGLETKENSKNLTGDVEMNFTLAPKWDPDAMMSWAEWLTFLPKNIETVKMSGCVGCHNLSWTLRDRKMRGAKAAAWEAGLASMEKKLGRSFGESDPQTKAEVFAILEKYFGPNAPLPTMNQVQHVEMSDAALRATWREYRPPTVTNFIHSIDADAKGQVWFAEWDRKANKVGRFDPGTEEIQELAVPTPGAFPHTPLTGKDGRISVTEGAVNSLGLIDPETGKYTEYRAPTPGSPHTSALDSAGNIWYCDGYGSVLGAKVGRFDPRTLKFTEFLIPVPPPPPDASNNLYWQAVREAQARNSSMSSESGGSNQGGAKPKDAYGLYAIGVDSHDNIWVSTSELGNIIRLDSKTGESKFYPIPGGQHMKGVAVDKNDNVWFSSYSGHRLGKIIPSTGEIKLYQMPTPNASTYGIVMDKKNGYLWTPDFSGNHITRFNLQTEEFTEYRFPTPNGMARFIGLDPKGRVVFTESTAGVFGILDPGDTGAAGNTRGLP